ncbi:MAG: ABC transporter ATP-binding protein [Phycisphaerales bacterium]|nr:ABC transporter ATP-binding protein [Phycisphaerales bacterium]
MPDPVIDIREASKTYRLGDVEVRAVRSVSMAVENGDFVAITGPSGSGKSTFMHLVGCLDRLDSGAYHFEGKPIQRLSRVQLAALRNHRIGFVFQSFNLLSRTTIVDNVALPLMYQGVRRRARRKRAAEMLDRVGLGDRLKHHPNQLSGGQQQRVAVARAIITKPAVLLADEPTGALDTTTGERLMQLFRELNRDDRVTIMIVTHEPEIAAWAERHVAFRDGVIESDKRKRAGEAA